MPRPAPMVQSACHDRFGLSFCWASSKKGSQNVSLNKVGSGPLVFLYSGFCHPGRRYMEDLLLPWPVCLALGRYKNRSSTPLSLWRPARALSGSHSLSMLVQNLDILRERPSSKKITSKPVWELLNLLPGWRKPQRACTFCSVVPCHHTLF